MLTDDKTLPAAPIEFLDLHFHPAQHKLYRNGEPIRLTPKPLSALEFLIENRHRAVSKDELLDRVWGGLRTAGAVEQAISYLRKALDDDSLEPRYIQTVPGQGYRWVATANPPAPTKMADETQPTSAPAENPPAIHKHRNAFLGAALAATIVACLAITFAVRHGTTPDRLASIALHGNTLTATSDTGHPLWNYTFDTPLREDLTAPPLWRKQIVDLNHDGDKQVLVAVDYDIYLRGPHELFCFSSRGKLLWRYRPALAAEFRTKDLNGPWFISHLIVVPEGKNTSIWLAINHSVWWPAFMVRLSSVGTPRVMFLSSGMITELFRIQNAAGSFILASGVNNEYRTASLAAIAQDGAPATSPQSVNSPYECAHNCPPGKPYRYFLLPRSELGAFSEVPYNVAEYLHAREDGVTAEVDELREFDMRPGFSSFYGFSRALNPTSVAYGDSYPELHRAAEKRGWVTHTLANCPERNRPAAVKVADENGRWTQVLVPRTPY
jgi:DNA-binding winged helix-turn-helix (wHTH) protein